VAFLVWLAQRAREKNESGKGDKLPHPQTVYLLLVLRRPLLVSMPPKQKNLHLLHLPRKRNLDAEVDVMAELQPMALKLKFRIFFNAQKDHHLPLFRKMHPVRQMALRTALLPLRT
jgi:hypothetical protein